MNDTQVIARMRRYERIEARRVKEEWDFPMMDDSGICEVCGGLGWIAEDVPCDCETGRDPR